MAPVDNKFTTTWKIAVNFNIKCTYHIINEIDANNSSTKRSTFCLLDNDIIFAISIEIKRFLQRLFTQKAILSQGYLRM